MSVIKLQIKDRSDSLEKPLEVGSSVQLNLQIVQSVWVRFEGRASYGQNIWLLGAFSQDFSWHSFMGELTSRWMA